MKRIAKMTIDGLDEATDGYDKAIDGIDETIEALMKLSMALN